MYTFHIAVVSKYDEMVVFLVGSEIDM